MKKRVMTTLLCLFFIFSNLACASAASIRVDDPIYISAANIKAEERASQYFDAYMLGVSPNGNGEMDVTFGVFCSRIMDKIGVYSLRIESEIASGIWVEEFTVYGSDDPDLFYDTDTIQHGGDFYFDGIPGVKYRAVMVAYATDAAGEEYSREITCTGRYCE